MHDDATDTSPFHAGEKAVQAQLGTRDVEVWARHMIRPAMPEQHRSFFAHLPFIIAAARDARDRPWATVLTGDAGFITSPHPRRLHVAARPLAGDALAEAFVDGDVGLLGIELSTRRRNRVNGKATTHQGVLTLEVEQSFGNCPQYIHERHWQRVPPTPQPPRRGRGLASHQQAQIAAADTFFIASGYRGDGEHASYGMDASHRGGAPGFVRVDGPRRLVFPDYAGNNLFNTIGNLTRDARIGLLFIDFRDGGILQLTGRATIVFEGERLLDFAGAQRLIDVEIDEVVELPRALPFRWHGNAHAVRDLRVVEKRPESDDVTSFVLASRDGGRLPSFEAGQHLPLVLQTGHGQRIERSYSLSSGPNDERYRITVKRHPHGVGSRYLHDVVEVGAIVSARPPSGDFVLPPGEKPVVLLSAGVGITPMVSMLRSLAAAGSKRPVHVIHAARDADHHPLRDEVRALVDQLVNGRLHVVYSAPSRKLKSGPSRGAEAPARVHRRENRSEKCSNYASTGSTAAARPGRMTSAMPATGAVQPPAGPHGQMESPSGRLDESRLRAMRIDEHADVFLCGPERFMADMMTLLRAEGFELDRLHTETFGPKG